MITALAWTCAALALALALAAGVATVRGRRVDDAQLLLAAACTLGALVQAVVGVVLFVRLPAAGAPGARHVSPALFAGYLLVAVLVPPLGAFWAIGERSRWGTGVLAVAGVTSAVLVARLEQVWGSGG